MEGIEALVDSFIEDSDEEFYHILTTPRPPPPSLGFLSPTSNILDITVANKTYSIKQSPGLLASSHKDGTTGAVVWRISLPLAEALLGILRDGGDLVQSSSNVLELGTGISGLLAVSVGAEMRRWICTDVDTVLKGLKENVRENLPAGWSEREDGVFVYGTGSKKSEAKKRRKGTGKAEESGSERRIEVSRLNWETDDVEHLPSLRKNGQFIPLDLIVSCDGVYNSGLIPPLISVLVAASQQSCKAGRIPKVIVILEVRAEEVLETWIREFHKHFHCGRIKKEVLGNGWTKKGGDSGVAYIGVLREQYLDGYNTSLSYLVDQMSIDLPQE